MSDAALIDRIVTLAADREPQRAWTETEYAFMREHLPALGYAGVAEALGRSVNAVKIKQVRARIPAPSKRPGWYTANEMARLLGMDNHVAARLEAQGRVRFERLAGTRGIRVIRREALWLWAFNPVNWMCFKTARIRDPRLRRLVELRQARWNDEWWTTQQTADFFGLATSNSVTAAIDRGQLPAVRWGNWYIRRSDALARWFWPGRGSRQGKNYWSPGADAFILRARDEWGLSFPAIDRMAKFPAGRAAYRYGLLKAGVCAQTQERGE